MILAELKQLLLQKQAQPPQRGGLQMSGLGILKESFDGLLNCGQVLGESDFAVALPLPDQILRGFPAGQIQRFPDFVIA